MDSVQALGSRWVGVRAPSQETLGGIVLIKCKTKNIEKHVKNSYFI